MFWIALIASTLLPIQRDVACPDLQKCNGNNPYNVQLGSNGVQCNYLRYGPGPGREIQLFRCYVSLASAFFSLLPSESGH